MAVCFLWHFPPLTGTGSYPARCPMESGLSSDEHAMCMLTSDHPAHCIAPCNALSFILTHVELGESDECEQGSDGRLSALIHVDAKFVQAIIACAS